MLTATAVGLASLQFLGACGGSEETNGRSGTNVPATTGDSSTRQALANASTAENTPPAGNRAAPGLPRVVLLGTSLTAGLGLSPEQAYPALLQAKADSVGLAVRVVNAGLSGETSAGALRRAAWVLDQPAALVVLEVGANDGLRGVDPDSTYANLVKLVETVRRTQPDARLALVQMEAPTNLGGDYTTRFHAAYVRAAEETGVPLWPFLLDRVAGVARLNQGDGIHPNEEGSKVVAKTMWGALEPALRALPRP
ncbi:arylesterase [Gemmatimonas phototrophica]|uniref:SGNH hydrolase-type esterase domain-containing protein n=1 Tax=Gemmatimonas phototrophica TaxID=1379270 RepID=A0A143BJJ4_9BACT|nr:arylesterase [Gemmatimonas phototrophica]AMW05198.1 hypothetical protein GEMMAAP_11005 [Gemmatimonas phototrophica]